MKRHRRRRAINIVFARAVTSTPYYSEIHVSNSDSCKTLFDYKSFKRLCCFSEIERKTF